LALDRLFETHLSMEKLLEMGKKLGADVPFCIIKNTSLAEGIGEKLSPVKMPFAPACLLVKPEASISTPVIYRDVDALIEAGNAVRPDTDKLLEAINCVDKETFYKELVNIFEPVSSVYCEDIFKYKAMIKEYGADASLMSGSGPTVFGLFENETVAQRAYEELRKQTAESGQDVRVFLTHFYS